MEPLELNQKKQKITHCLSCLPRKILKLHGRANIVEFIMHELGRKDCFDFERVAYIIDNPDFNCLKGVAGLCSSEIFQAKNDIWIEQDEFTLHMKEAPYNKKVRCFEKESCIRLGETDEQIVKKFASDLDFEHPSFYSWPMKHDNHGILLYECAEGDHCDCEYLLEGLSLFGFCPIY